jgi:hypothetical protein
MKKIFQLIFWLILSPMLFSQNVSINGTGAAPNASAMLDISATNKGLLIPRVALTAANSNLPVGATITTSLMVYNTATNGAGVNAVSPGYYYWNGTRWVSMSGDDWRLTGNAGTNPTTNFLGTTDAQDLVFRTNNTEIVRILSAGNVGVGTPGPLADTRLDVLGNGTFTTAIAGVATSVGVFGGANAATGFGVYANNNNANGTGLISVGNNYTGNYMVSGSGEAATGYHGVYATGANALGTGVIAVGNNNPGIFTFPNGGGGAFTGDLNGVAGYAENTSNGAYGVYGQYDGGMADGRGVYGWSYPVAGWGFGVYGYGGFYGVFSNGDFGATGAKTFIIDHPADPENKMIKHFSIESNEVLNVYRGNVVLDANGEAEIQLPDYFHLINTNFSYNLTPIGAPAQMYVLEEINEEGKFKIAGGSNGQKISWYVYAERNDPYMQQNPEKKQVVIEKEGERKGKYFMPELYNQPDSKGYDSKKGYKTVNEKAIKTSK